jgi:hypothetical protein
MGVNKECFCGCGRRISVFPLGLRQLNARGAEVAERLAHAERVFSRTTSDRQVRGWYRDGDEIVEALTTTMHGSRPLPRASEGWIHAWLATGRDIEQRANRSWAAFFDVAQRVGVPQREAETVFRRSLLEGSDPAQLLATYQRA